MCNLISPIRLVDSIWGIVDNTAERFDSCKSVISVGMIADLSQKVRKDASNMCIRTHVVINVVMQFV